MDDPHKITGPGIRSGTVMIALCARVGVIVIGAMWLF